MARQPASVSSSSARERLTTRATGTRSTAPAAALARAPVNLGAWRSCRITPTAPKAAAERSMAPTFCGSVTWSSISSTAPGLGSKSARSAGSRTAPFTATPWCTEPCGRRWAICWLSACCSVAGRPNFASICLIRSGVARISSAGPRRGLASAASTACQPQIQSSATASGRLRNPPWAWRFRPRRASLRSGFEATIRRAPNWGPGRVAALRTLRSALLCPSHP